MSIFCDECRKNIATVFLTKMSGTEVSKVQLCEECAYKMEETTEAANLLAFIPQIISGLQGVEENLTEEVLGSEPVTCPNCSTSFNDFQKMGFLGCRECYTVFGEHLERVILEFQDASEHVGKAPAKASENARLRRRVMELERDLQRQIESEQYEAAAAARDQIMKIRGMLKAEGTDGEAE